MLVRTCLSTLAILLVANCGATTTKPHPEKTLVCHFGNDLPKLESMKSQIDAASDKAAIVSANKQTLLDIAEKSAALNGSERQEDRLGCKFLEMETRVLLLGLPATEQDNSTFEAALTATNEMIALCTPQADQRMCSAARIHSASLFSDKAAEQLYVIGEQDADTPINWQLTLNTAGGLEEHIRENWKNILDNESDETTKAAISRSLLASLCVADKGMVSINRRAGLAINRVDGKFVPFIEHSGKVLAQGAIALDLSPGDACYENTEDFDCMNSLANQVHLVCERTETAIN